MRISDWSSDVCSSDLSLLREGPVAQLLDLFVEADGAVIVGGDAFEHLDALFEGADLRLQRLGLGIVARGNIGAIAAVTAAVAMHAIFRPDDAADRHDEDDADDHFKGVHGEGSRSEEHTSELQSLMR